MKGHSKHGSHSSKRKIDRRKKHSMFVNQAEAKANQDLAMMQGIFGGDSDFSVEEDSSIKASSKSSRALQWAGTAKFAQSSARKESPAAVKRSRQRQEYSSSFGSSQILTSESNIGQEADVQKKHDHRSPRNITVAKLSHTEDGKKERDHKISKMRQRTHSDSNNMKNPIKV